jgi:hypothetical protein
MKAIYENKTGSGLHVAWIGARNLKCKTKTITRKASAIRSESRCGTQTKLAPNKIYSGEQNISNKIYSAEQNIYGGGYIKQNISDT